MPKDDSRTPKEITTETCELICALQDAIGNLFPWRLYDCDEVVLSNDTIKLLVSALKK